MKAIVEWVEGVTGMEPRRWVSRGVWQAVGLLVLAGVGRAAEPEPVRVLLFSGMNNHDWRKTTPCLEKILDPNEGFSVRVTERPGACTAEDFAGRDVIVSNWNAWGQSGPEAQWTEATREAFLDFIERGGGHVTVHAGGSSLYDWPAYHRIAASWGEKTSHGPNHTFRVDIVDPNHALVRGLVSFAIYDELWNQTQFPPDSHVLMTAYSDKAQKGTGKAEPVLCVSQYGRGRCVNLMLGHDVRAMQTPGFAELLRRSCLWAAKRDIGTQQKASPED